MVSDLVSVYVKKKKPMDVSVKLEVIIMHQLIIFEHLCIEYCVRGFTYIFSLKKFHKEIMSVSQMNLRFRNVK